MSDIKCCSGPLSLLRWIFLNFAAAHKDWRTWALLGYSTKWISGDFWWWPVALPSSCSCTDRHESRLLKVAWVVFAQLASCWAGWVCVCWSFLQMSTFVSFGWDLRNVPSSKEHPSNLDVWRKMLVKLITDQVLPSHCCCLLWHAAQEHKAPPSSQKLA